MTDNQPIEYHVIFTQGRNHLARWLRPNFSHVYIVTRDQYNWILINPARLYLQVIIPPLKIDASSPYEIWSASDRVLKVSFKRRDSRIIFGQWGLFNCVTVAKYILGLKVFALTPWQLYKTLLRFDTNQRLKHGIISVQRVQ